jgi:hypothetical protein
LLDTIVGIFDATKATFEGLQEEPEGHSNTSNWPGDEKKQQEPQKRVTGIRSHFRRLCFQ